LVLFFLLHKSEDLYPPRRTQVRVLIFTKNTHKKKEIYNVLGVGISENVELEKGSKDFGINMSVKYRFYLGSVNKYSASFEVYIGSFLFIQ